MLQQKRLVDVMILDHLQKRFIASSAKIDAKLIIYLCRMGKGRYNIAYAIHWLNIHAHVHPSPAQ